ncbi:DUF7005 family protein [Nostoc sp. MG11]|uniref:DUF7005 family protein n=1 Tax=Nostoc sp. MG11 TaxID=2721166 RepID=UPI001866B476|nr:hypothetical protein [Nostoc sp. MG11]
MIDLQLFRTNVLAHFGATAAQTEELLVYNQNVFNHNTLTHTIQFPLPPEAHVAAWEGYALAAKVVGTFDALKRVLFQLKFPIVEGISQTQTYQAASRRGVVVDGGMAEATGLVLQQPQKLQLILHQSLAGTIPVLLTENRDDFVSLVQALTKRNEPHPVPTSMGACLVSGFNNWDRIYQYRQKWEAESFANRYQSTWQEEFQRLIPQKKLYQDKFIILSSGSYSNVSANDMELEESQWQSLSLTIRLEHECIHYFTRRLFHSMRNNILDELIADYRGIVAATGYYRADWCLRFLGLESFPHYREGGRLQNYRGQPPLSDKAFAILQALVKAAAENLQRFHTDYPEDLTDANMQPLMLMCLTHLTLEELASQEAKFRIQQTLNKLQTVLTI